MTKRILSLTLAVLTMFALCAPAFAAEAPSMRPAQVNVYEGGELKEQTVLTYESGSPYPSAAQTLSAAGEVEKTYEFDENGRLLSWITPTVSETFVYDEDGRELEMHYISTGDNPFEYSWIYTYSEDENGRLIESSDTFSQVSSGVALEPSTTTSTYEYDDSGLLTSKVSVTPWSDGTTTEESTSYVYNENGTLIEERSISPYGETYETYDEFGRLLISDSGDMYLSNTYASEEDPCFTVVYVDDNRYGTASIYLSVQLLNEAGDSMISFSLDYDQDPVLTYDDDGYMVKADAGNGAYIEFVYEPIG